jgi:ATP-binding cassette subfamily B protein
VNRTASSRLIRLFASVDRRFTVALVTLSVVRGLLFPTLTISIAGLVGALRDGRSTTVWLAVVVTAFAVRRVLDPLVEELGGVLARRTDEELLARTMAAMLAPTGMAHVEDPGVQDRIAQAQGNLTTVTPGEAARRVHLVWASWLRGGLSLLIVARHYPLLALALAATYAVGYRVARAHWHEVTLVMFERTDELRRAYYLRTLALTSEAAKETRVFGLAEWLVLAYRSSWLEVMRRVWSQRDEGWWPAIGTTVLIGAVEVATLVSTGQDAATGGISLAVAIATASATLASGDLATYDEDHWVMGEAVRAAETIAALQDVSSPGAVVAGGSVLPDRPRESIRFEGLHFAYPAGDPVFAALDLTITAGTSLAIVGENGAGKTTLVKLLGRLYDPTAGRITVDGVDLRDLDVEAWRRQVAVVFQDYLQFELSARDNVTFGAVEGDWSDGDLDEVAALAGATALVGRLDRGWDTPLSREVSDGTALSGGEWQRLALARAMLAVRTGAGVLVLDEPTAAMDVRGEAEIYARFLELTSGLTTLVISHRFSTVRRADRIVVVEHGQIVEDGDHISLMAADGIYARMYRLQAARFVEAS